MSKEYITASYRFGQYNPIGKVYPKREVAQYHADADNRMFPDLEMQVIEVDTDDLSDQPPEIQAFVTHQLKVRRRTFVHRAGDKHLIAVHPLETDQVQLKEGDSMVKIDPPKRENDLGSTS